MYTMYVWHIQHIAAPLSNKNNWKVLRVYVCAYLLSGGYLAVHPREGQGQGESSRSVRGNGPKIISQGRVQESSRSYRTRVWRQTIHIHTYIHTYIPSSIYSCILHRRQQPSWEEGVLRCLLPRRTPMPTETHHDQWEGFHPRRHMYGRAGLSLCRGEQRHSAVTAAGDLEAVEVDEEVEVDIGSRRAPNTPHDLNHA